MDISRRRSPFSLSKIPESKFNKQQIENTELKETSKNIEKELDENIRLLANREKK